MNAHTTPAVDARSRKGSWLSNLPRERDGCSRAGELAREEKMSRANAPRLDLFRSAADASTRAAGSARISARSACFCALSCRLRFVLERLPSRASPYGGHALRRLAL